MNLVLRATTAISVEEVPRSVPIKLAGPKSLSSPAEAASSSNNGVLTVTAATKGSEHAPPLGEEDETTPVGGPGITETNGPDDLSKIPPLPPADEEIHADESNPVSGNNQEVDYAKEILEELTEASKPAVQMLLSGGEVQEELSVSDPQTVSAVVNYMKVMDGKVQALARGMSFLIEKQQREHVLSKLDICLLPIPIIVRLIYDLMNFSSAAPTLSFPRHFISSDRSHWSSSEMMSPSSGANVMSDDEQMLRRYGGAGRPVEAGCYEAWDDVDDADDDEPLAPHPIPHQAERSALLSEYYARIFVFCKCMNYCFMASSLLHTNRYNRPENRLRRPSNKTVDPR
ncbi:MAG TPA: hypothetical protein VK145_02635 [Candidatus Nanoarchaeia archaeon]|nr:hypothetical protein [Candidatus Nanoarchaeia archaeon]